MGLGVIRSLGRRGVEVVAAHYDTHEMAHHSKYVVERVAVPHPENEQEDFVDSLLGLASRYEGSVLFPTDDPALVGVSRHWARLADVYEVAAGDWSETQLFIEKQHTYELGERFGVRVPRTAFPRTTADVDSFMQSAEYPVLVKPSQSHLFKAHFGQKMVEVSTDDQLERIYRQSVDRGLEVMFQEIIPGPDRNVVNYNAFAVSGTSVVEFTARQVRKFPSVYGSPRVAVTEVVPDVVEPGRAIINALGFEGFACVEFKIDSRTGEPVLMEVNGRHNLSSWLAVSVGVDFPWMHYNYLANGVKPQAVEEYREGVYWIDLARDLAGFLVHRKDEGLGTRDLLRPYLRPHVFAIAALNDPVPMVVRILDVARRFMSRLQTRSE